MTEEEREGMVDRRAASRMKDQGGTEDPAASTAPQAAEPIAGNEDPIPAGDVTENADLAEAVAKADSYYRSWQRSAADFANYKKRVESEKGEMARFASAALVINLLPVYDDLERAVATVDANLAGLNWVQGVTQIQRKFAGLLQAMGIEEIPAAGQQFDPSLHEAVAKQPGDEGKILHVVQKGYKLSDRVLRPAMVIVGDG